jgi:hypothetical protein
MLHRVGTPVTSANQRRLESSHTKLCRERVLGPCTIPMILMSVHQVHAVHSSRIELTQDFAVPQDEGDRRRCGWVDDRRLRGNIKPNLVGITFAHG